MNKIKLVLFSLVFLFSFLAFSPTKAFAAPLTPTDCANLGASDPIKTVCMACVSQGFDYNGCLAANPPDADNTILLKVEAPANAPEDLGKLIGNGISLVLIVAALATFIYLIFAGLQWITSGGDKSAVEAAQKRIQAAIIGLFVIFAAWGIMSILAQFFGLDLGSLKLPKATD